MEETNIVVNSIKGLSYGGVFVLAFISNMFVPVPEELILLGMGYLTGIGSFNYAIVMALFVIGMLLSDYLLYSLSFRGSKLVKKLFVRLEKRGYLKNEDYMKKHMKKIIFFSRFMIYLRFIGPVMAGYFKTPKKDFLKYDALALVIYVNIFLAIGNRFHRQIEIASEGISQFKDYIVTGLIILATISVLRWINRKTLYKLSHIDAYIPTIIPGLSQKSHDEAEADDSHL